jgi:hypothetical protein
MSGLEALLQPTTTPVGTWLKAHVNGLCIDGGTAGQVWTNQDGKGTGAWASGGGGITTARFTITSANLLNAGSANIPLISAPAANTANLVVYFYATLVSGTQYASGGSPNYAGLVYGTGTGPSGGIVGNLDALITAATTSYQFETSAFGPITTTPAAQPIGFVAQTNYSTGTGSLILEIGYVNVRTN